MNTDLSERFGRRGAFRGRDTNVRANNITKPHNRSIGQYFKRTIGDGAPRWTLRPEIPTFDELSPYSAFPSQAPTLTKPKPHAKHKAWKTNDVRYDVDAVESNKNRSTKIPAQYPPQSDSTPVIHDPTETLIGRLSTDVQSKRVTNVGSTIKRQASNRDIDSILPVPECEGYEPIDVDQAHPLSASKSDNCQEMAEEEDEADIDGYRDIVNYVKGPWPSRDVYLRNHYLLLREDALRPLREAVKIVRANPQMSEDPKHSTIGIYDQVRICGVTFSRRGLGIRVQFSLGRVGKNIHWEQSKRLLSSSLVVLMSNDNARVCKVATVAARTLLNLAKNPPELDLFFHGAEDLDMDSARDWILIEERSGFYEAHRHTMTALQRMAAERFPLSDHLVDVQCQVAPPEYISKSPLLDLGSVFSKDQSDESAPLVNVLDSWPQSPTSELDKSQSKALHNILTKRVSIVQGPPGTGKTFVSTQALRAMCDNMDQDDPPMIVACHTNHALDQLLRHIAEFEPRFARVGGRTKDKDVIKKRTLYELKLNHQQPKGKGIQAWKQICGKMAAYLTPLIKGPAETKDVLDADLLEELEILSHAQVESLTEGAKEWVNHCEDGSDASPLLKWIGKALVPVKARLLPTLLEYEEIDEEARGYEEVLEQEAETVTAEEEDELEMLRGDYYMIGNTWTGNANDSRGVVEHAKLLLKTTPDLWKIKMKNRGAVYRHMQHQVKEKIILRLRKMMPDYLKACEELKVARYEVEEMVLRDQKIIGLTTTGVSKYRPLIASLKPRVILIEEAAETLEAPVIAACVESVQHLILVGDHQQLRPNCHVRELQNAPYHLNISLFERLVNNEVEYTILSRQRRMHPEIRRLLVPIYGGKVKDHKSVEEKEPVPGMNGLRTWFFTHDYPDDRDVESSSFNMHEVHMIFGLIQYLRYNGLPAKEITILTFYNGQRRRLIRRLRAADARRVDDTLNNIQVVTVDSYQGEENGVVILSLVRSNPDGKLGFISNENRICVALSRAQRGFYIFGNGLMLAQESWLWSQVITTMYVKVDAAQAATQYPPRARIGYTIPLFCARHQRRFWIKDPQDWASNDGGCDTPCRDLLSCGHTCPRHCHPFDHANVLCIQPCETIVHSCGHRCSLSCSVRPCVCRLCAVAPRSSSEIPERSISDDSRFRPEGIPQEFIAYAQGGVEQADKLLDVESMPHAAREEKLIDIDDDDDDDDNDNDNDNDNDDDYDPTLTRVSLVAGGKTRREYEYALRPKDAPASSEAAADMPSLLDM